MTPNYASFAQAPPATAPEKRPPMPKPTNLKVLPADIETGALIGLMRGYSSQLGVQCEYCHAENATTHRPNFADDSKPEKTTARVMITMTDDINAKYIAKLPMSDQKVTCGTCHRGHPHPEPFTPVEQQHAEPVAPAPHPPS